MYDKSFISILNQIHSHVLLYVKSLKWEEPFGVGNKLKIEEKIVSTSYVSYFIAMWQVE
jgi:hypothetical protein